MIASDFQETKNVDTIGPSVHAEHARRRVLADVVAGAGRRLAVAGRGHVRARQGSALVVAASVDRGRSRPSASSSTASRIGVVRAARARASWRTARTCRHVLARARTRARTATAVDGASASCA